MSNFTIDCTGDACKGDVIRFTEAVFGGSYKRPTHLGDRVIEAEIVADSYGADRQQHTFTLLVLASSGAETLAAGVKTRRKGRNVYRNGTHRQPWANEAARKAALGEKHSRGDDARAARDERKAGNVW
jgi:hypothetical protein